MVFLLVRRTHPLPAQTSSDLSVASDLRHSALIRVRGQPLDVDFPGPQLENKVDVAGHHSNRGPHRSLEGLPPSFFPICARPWHSVSLYRIRSVYDCRRRSAWSTARPMSTSRCFQSMCLSIVLLWIRCRLSMGHRQAEINDGVEIHVAFWTLGGIPSGRRSEPPGSHKSSARHDACGGPRAYGYRGTGG
jgi:hypothetical protein